MFNGLIIIYWSCVVWPSLLRRWGAATLHFFKISVKFDWAPLRCLFLYCSFGFFHFFLCVCVSSAFEFFIHQNEIETMPRRRVVSSEEDKVHQDVTPTNENVTPTKERASMDSQHQRFLILLNDFDTNGEPLLHFIYLIFLLLWFWFVGCLSFLDFCPFFPRSRLWQFWCCRCLCWFWFFYSWNGEERYSSSLSGYCWQSPKTFSYCTYQLQQITSWIQEYEVGRIQSNWIF